MIRATLPRMATACRIAVACVVWTLGVPVALAQPEGGASAESPGETPEGAETPDGADGAETPSGSEGPETPESPETPEPRPEVRDSRDKQPAEILFDQGLKDMLAGKFDTACPALAESFRLDPAPGALFTLAECEMGRGRFASAQTHYRDYLDRVDRMTDEGKERQQQRVEVAEGKLAELAGKVPKLTLRLPDDAPEDVVVKRDGQLIAPAMLGRALPVDPGEYTVTVEGPGRRTTERRVAVAEGAREEVVLVVGLTGDPPLHGMEIGAIVAGSVGLAALVGGTIAGAIAVSKKGTIEDQCNEQRQCSPAGLDAVSSGQAAGTASTVLLVIAGVGVGVGVTLWVLAPDGEDGASDDAPSDSPRDGSSPFGTSSLELDLAPRPGGGTVGLTLTF
ncbi:MAG: hypothetical protein RIF41_29155 [Polyangiaceae bacterium]